MIRRPDPSRFLKATPEVADCTIYAERVMPARLARRSIISIWFSRAVTLTRTVLVLLKSVVTRNATAFSRLGSPAKSSILEGLGIFSASLVERLSGCHAAGEVREADAKIRLTVFVQIGDVVHFTSA